MISDAQFKQLSAVAQDIPEDELEIEYKLYSMPPADAKFTFSNFTRIRDAIWTTKNGTFASTRDETFANDDGDEVRRTTVLKPSVPDLPEPDGPGAAVGTVTYMRKTRLERINPALDCLYLSVSREEMLDSMPRDMHAIGHIRQKDRWSAYLPGLRVDFTRVVTTSNTGESTSYEIEIEMPRSLDTIGRTLMDLNTQVSGILKVVHDTNYVYPLSLKSSVFNIFNSKFNTRLSNSSRITSGISQAVDLKPLNLARGDLLAAPTRANTTASPMAGGFVSGPPGKYGVSHKADGVRRFLIVYKGDVFLIGAPYSMNYLYRLKTSEEDALIIIEGELVPPENRFNTDVMSGTASAKPITTPLYLAYDLLWVNKTNAAAFPYYMRMEQLRSVVQMFTNTRDLMDVSIKEFYPFSTPAEFFELNNKLLNMENVQYKIDGLMYTPTHAPYSVAANRELNSDFKIFKWKSPHDLTIDFVIRDGVAYSQGRAGLEVFEPKFPVMPHPELEEGIVNEFKMRGDSWVFVRKRNMDKETPNATRVATDVFRLIEDPLEVSVIRGQRFRVVYAVSNEIKRAMYRNIPTGMNVISIGSGRGGDLHKWRSAGVKFVEAVEPDNENADEFEDRYINGRFPFNTVVHRVTGQEFNWKRTGPTVVEFMLSLSFFTPDEMMRLLEPMRSGDWLLIYTINGDKVREHFENPNNYTLTPSGMKRSTINQIIFAYSPNTDKVFVQIPNSIVRGQTENLVPMKEIDKRLRSNGFVPDGRVNNYRVNAILNRDEQRWLALFEPYIYTKR